MSAWLQAARQSAAPALSKTIFITGSSPTGFGAALAQNAHAPRNGSAPMHNGCSARRLARRLRAQAEAMPLHLRALGRAA